jgi:hypothetical protein
VSRVPEAIRRAVRQRAQERCDYCLIPEAELLFRHEADHILAAQHGGAPVLENLALACADCNRYKGPNLSSTDSETGAIVPLFHLRRDRWDEHFVVQGSHIMGRTPTGRATVFLLKLNSEERVLARRALQRAGRYPQPV